MIAVDLNGNSEVILRGTSFPLCVDWLPDGSLLVVSARDRLLLRREHDGSLVTYGNPNTASDPPAINELVVDGRGNAYVNGGGFDMMAGEQFAPGVIALVTPGGPARQVANGLAFPNGMLVLPGGSTLIVAKSYANRLTAFDIDADGGLSNRRVWADLGEGVPDSLCADTENAVWYADVPNKRCVRVREGGQVLETIGLDRGCFACALGGAAIAAMAAPMVFELPFDLIVMARTYPPIPPHPALYRVLFFAPLFLVEITTLALLTWSPMARLTRATFYAFALMLAVLRSGPWPGSNTPPPRSLTRSTW